MGTSANLYVKCADKHLIQHTSYDGYPGNVLAEIGSTIAACGLDVLQESIGRAIIAPDAGDMEQTRAISIQISLEKYFKAAQARNNDPVGLLGVLRNPYSIRDFAHGGVSVLLGSPLVSDVGFCAAPENADFVLDLDNKILFAPNYQDATSPVPQWSIDLARIEQCDPHQVQWAFRDINLAADNHQANAQAIEQCLVCAETGQASPLPVYQATDAMPVSHPAPPPTIDAPGSHGAGLHQFRAHEENPFAIRMLIALLQRAASQAPALARPGVLMACMSPNEDEEISLTVDLSSGFASEEVASMTHDLVGKVGELAETFGMLYQFKGDGVSQSFGGGAICSTISIGGDGGFDDDDDELASLFGEFKIKVPEAATPVRTQKTRLVDIAEDAQCLDDDAIENLAMEKLVARSNFDEEILSAIPASIVLSPDQVKQSNMLIQLVGPLEDASLPGNRRRRFLSLPPDVRQEILASFSDMGRYVIAAELDLPPDTPTRSSPRP